VGLSLIVEYSNPDGMRFYGTPLNTTVTLSDPPVGFDIQLYSVYGLGVLSVVGLGYWTKTNFLDANVKKPKTKKVVSVAGQSEESTAEEWIPEHHRPAAKKRVVKDKKKD